MPSTVLANNVCSLTVILLLLRPRERLRSTVKSMSVCRSVCLYVCPRGDVRNHLCALYQIFCACCLCPWLGLLQHVYDRPHRWSTRRGFLPHWKCIISWERGMAVHSTGKVCCLRFPCFCIVSDCVHACGWSQEEIVEMLRKHMESHKWAISLSVWIKVVQTYFTYSQMLCSRTNEEGMLRGEPAKSDLVPPP